MANGSQQQSSMIKIGALWAKQKKDGGDKYLSGTLGNDARLLVFKNKYKKQENHPDFIVYLAPKEDRGQGGGQSQGSSQYHNDARGQGAPPQGQGQGQGYDGAPDEEDLF